VAPPVLSLRDVSLDLGDKVLFSGVDLAVGAGDRLCLVGRNGSGKSTLLQMLAGQRDPDHGERFAQTGTRVAYLPQEPDFTAYATVFDAVAAAVPAPEGAPDHQIDRMLDSVYLATDADPATLSGGEQRRLGLARALVGAPDVLLLDEPTNHLDIAAIEWLESTLQDFKGAFVIVSHDRRFLADLTRATLWLDRGRLRRLDKGFRHFEDWSEEVLAQEAREQDKLNKLIAQETVWSHQGITARRRRNQGRLRRLHAMRSERAKQIRLTGRARLDVESGEASGRLVVDADHVSKRFGENVILDDFSTRIMRGDRVGIIGPNGAGKTTLMRILTGDLAPDDGIVRLGTNLTPVYVDQRRQQLDPRATLWQTLCSGGGDHVLVQGRSRHAVSYLKDFLFDEGQARSPVSSLSGGERNRLLLAKSLASPSNFLVLDEPTNDLDMDTLDLLQDVLADYDGTVLVISHDRDFLDRLVTSTIALEGRGRAVEYAGGYADVERQRAARGDDASSDKTDRQKPAPAETKGRAESKVPTKLSYNQQRALEQLPGEIDRLNRELVDIRAALAEPTLYETDPERFAAMAARLEEAEAALAEREERWLELEILREEIDHNRSG
jgi:ATP-binding cassette subfamily F protein uup